MIQDALLEQQITERYKLVSLIRQWGLVNTDGLLDEHCRVYTHPEIEGFIGYRLEGKNAVVFGDPVCAPQDSAALAKAFQENCEQNQYGVVYTMATKEFADWAAENLSAITIEWGENYIMDPSINPLNNKGSKAVLLRKKVKHAVNDGVVIKEYLEHDPNVEKQILEVSEGWLQKRHGAQIYLCAINLFKDREGRRWFYAQQGDKITGFLVLNALRAKQGWLLNNLMNTKDAAPGVSELLITSVFQTLEQEGCHYLIIGPLPAQELRNVKGTSQILETVTRWLYKCATRVFHLKGWATFWQKFQPTPQGSYLIFPQKNLNVSCIRSILKAYNAGRK